MKKITKKQLLKLLKQALEACDMTQRYGAGDGVTDAEAVDASLLVLDKAKKLKIKY